MSIKRFMSMPNMGWSMYDQDFETGKSDRATLFARQSTEDHEFVVLSGIPSTEQLDIIEKKANGKTYNSLNEFISAYFDEGGTPNGARDLHDAGQDAIETPSQAPSTVLIIGFQSEYLNATINFLPAHSETMV